MSEKKRKPRLTEKAIQDLRTMLNYAEVELEAATGEGQDRDDWMESVDRGIEWLKRFLEASESQKDKS